MSRGIGTIITTTLVALTVAAAAHAGPVEKTKNAIDPDCTVAKAAKGAAERATVGVGNRCKAGETARDTLGIDGKGKKKDGPVKERRND